MKRTVGFSGAHGTGKSTLLNALRESQYTGVTVDTESMSRRVQVAINGASATLESVVSEASNIIRFQEQILKEKTLHLLKLRGNVPATGVLLTDRTPIDCYAYARMWVERHKFTGWEHWLYTYWTSCVKDMSQYDQVVLLPPAAFNFAEESQRAAKETQLLHHDYCNAFIDSIPLRNILLITSVPLDARVMEVASKLDLQKCSF